MKHKQTGQVTPIIKLTQTRRFGKGIDEWKNAITAAENIDMPKRVRLLDLYADMMLDTHLTSVVEKRLSNVASIPISFVKADGTRDDRMTQILESPWFDVFVKECLKARFWGYSLFQFDTDADGWPTCTVIDRKHVDPQRQIILRDQSDVQGTPFDQFYNLLLVGDGNDLGLLIKAARYVIYKNYDIGDWSEFAEIFGMPIRDYTYDATDEEARRQVVEDARTQGSNQVYIHPEGTHLSLIESAGKTGSLDVYKGLADFCNAEISKLILGNTLTTQAGDTGTQALGRVQQQGEEMILADDRKYVLNVLNYQLADLFAQMGIETKGGRFVYEESEDIDLEQQMRICQGLIQMGLDIDQDYLYEKFGVEKPRSVRSAGSRTDEPKEDKNSQDEDELADQRKGWQSFFEKGAVR